MHHSVGGVLSAVGWTRTSLPPRVRTGPFPRCDHPNQKSPDIAEHAPAGLGAHTPLVLENQGLKGNGRSGNHCRGPLDVGGGGRECPCTRAVFTVKHRFPGGEPFPSVAVPEQGLALQTLHPGTRVERAVVPGPVPRAEGIRVHTWSRVSSLSRDSGHTASGPSASRPRQEIRPLKVQAWPCVSSE